MLKIAAVLLGFTIAASAFALNESPFQERINEQIKKSGRQERLRMEDNRTVYSAKKTANEDGFLLAVAYCEDSTQVALNGGCSINGSVAKQEGAVTTYSSSEATLQSFETSYSSWLGVETHVCQYKNVKKGDIVTAKVTCK